MTGHDGIFTYLNLFHGGRGKYWKNRTSPVTRHMGGRP
jgi:hypothetical protein